MVYWRPCGLNPAQFMAISFWCRMGLWGTRCLARVRGWRRQVSVRTHDGKSGFAENEEIWEGALHPCRPHRIQSGSGLMAMTANRTGEGTMSHSLTRNYALLLAMVVLSGLGLSVFALFLIH